MNILVFCSAQEVSEKYDVAAKEFASLLGQGGHTLVWGGTDSGMMHTIAEAARSSGARLVGITTEYFKHKVRKDIDETVVTADISQRKKVMLQRGDAIVVLPGGIGTLDEASEMLALKREGTHRKPIVFLNTDGYYGGLQELFKRMQDDGFLGNVDNDVVPGLDIVYFADSPKQAIEYINTR